MVLNFGTDLFRNTNQYNDDGSLLVSEHYNLFQSSSNINLDGLTWDPYTLYDNDIATGPNTGSTHNDWLKIDLGSVKAGYIAIQYLLEKTSAGGSVTATLALSNDDSTYTTVETQTDAAAGTRTTYFTYMNHTAKCRYVKLTFTVAAGTGQAAVVEGKFYAS